MATGFASRNRDIVGPVERFDQKNDMFKRTRWDPDLREMGRSLWSELAPGGKEGFTLAERALENAGWHTEMGYAHGVQIHDSGLYSWTDNPAVRYHRYPPGIQLTPSDPVRMARQVKRAARFLGASLSRIAALDSRWVYSHSFHFVTREHREMEIPEQCRYAVVMAIEMDYTMIRTSPTSIGAATAGLAYSQMAFVAGSLAQFIRDLGYTAIPSGNDTALNIPLAIDAGMGELGRNGLLITQEFGPRVRLCKVLTDMPLEPDPPREFGVARFCGQCRKCARFCPGQAISHGERTDRPVNISNNGGVLKWPVNADNCIGFWAKNGATCANCIRVCPFNKPPGRLHDTVRWGVKRAPWANRLFLWGDDLLKYHDQIGPGEFWEAS